MPEPSITKTGVNLEGKSLKGKMLNLKHTATNWAN